MRRPAPCIGLKSARATDELARELDFRESAGIQITLLWQAIENRIWVRVRDVRTDDAFAFAVAPADALNAFHHPFAYAPTEYGRSESSALALQS